MSKSVSSGVPCAPRARSRVTFSSSLPSMTQQSDMPSTDINRIVKTGIGAVNSAVPLSMDDSIALFDYDFQSAQNRVVRARGIFDSLPP